ncbi:hypothetical protein Pan44_05770 [Caulifigura coniformis]|uniref:Uncharacterized protein n=1 Tax=Caulifigura coniformis TaxID=2527983 RepID=A0A517S8W1_9PLAN|nr:hypothetical protein Pan44_05770 [Caulifigura coniformis]
MGSKALAPLSIWAPLTERWHAVAAGLSRLAPGGGLCHGGRPVTRPVTAENGLNHWEYGPVTCVTCVTKFGVVCHTVSPGDHASILNFQRTNTSPLTGEVARGGGTFYWAITCGRFQRRGGIPPSTERPYALVACSPGSNSSGVISVDVGHGGRLTATSSTTPVMGLAMDSHGVGGAMHRRPGSFVPSRLNWRPEPLRADRARWVDAELDVRHSSRSRPRRVPGLRPRLDGGSVSSRRLHRR